MPLFLSVQFVPFNMPAGNEQYPSTRYPIESKSLEDLVHDPQYELYRFLSFERSRQLSLDPDEFESIPRDYCILQSPGKTSWLQKESQKPPDLKIFYADSVKIPKTEAVRKLGNATKYAIDNYLYPWYLQGMSRSNVDKLLRRRFGLSIPLSCESTADHWIPAAIVYCVEIKLDVWENRLALFFDGNMQTSVQPMKDRLGAYRGSIDPKVLGEVYLSAWRARWERNREPIPSENQTVQAASSSAKAKQSGSMQSLSMKTDADSSDPKPRGRKRRKVLRQLRSTPNELVRNIYFRRKIKNIGADQATGE
jgi:hypothetical protein